MKTYHRSSMYEIFVITLISGQCKLVTEGIITSELIVQTYWEDQHSGLFPLGLKNLW